MSARTAVVAEVRVRCILSYVRQIDARVLRTARWAIGCCCHGGQVLLQRRGVQFVWKWRHVVDEIRAFFIHGPDVAALETAVVVSARQFARERQKLARRTVTRWTVRDRDHGWGATHHPSGDGSRAIRESPYRNQCLCSKRSETAPLLAKDPALMIRADTTAPVVNDEEELARATTQAHKAARDGYRFDVGTFAIWAGCDRATTLVAGARHVRVLHLLLARGLNRLRRKWPDMADQLGVVFVHAPDVSARTAIVPRHPFARLGTAYRRRCSAHTQDRAESSWWEVIVSARNMPAEPQAICTTLRAVNSFVRPKSWDVIPFVSFATAARSFACQAHVGNSRVGWVGSLSEAGSGTASRSGAAFSGKRSS